MYSRSLSRWAPSIHPTPPTLPHTNDTHTPPPPSLLIGPNTNMSIGSWITSIVCYPFYLCCIFLAVSSLENNLEKNMDRDRGDSNACEGHMLIGFFLSLIASILLYVPRSPPVKGVCLAACLALWFADWQRGRLLVSLSTPTIKEIDFLHTPSTSFGAFGYCSTDTCESRGVGYDYEQLTRWLTNTAVLFPIGTSYPSHFPTSHSLSCSRLASTNGKVKKAFRG